MLFLVKLNPEFSSLLIEGAQATLALSLFLLTAKKKAIIVSFWWNSSLLTVARTAGAATVCKDKATSQQGNQANKATSEEGNQSTRQSARKATSQQG